MVRYYFGSLKNRYKGDATKENFRDIFRQISTNQLIGKLKAIPNTNTYEQLKIKLNIIVVLCYFDKIFYLLYIHSFVNGLYLLYSLFFYS